MAKKRAYKRKESVEKPKDVEVEETKVVPEPEPEVKEEIVSVEPEEPKVEKPKEPEIEPFLQPQLVDVNNKDYLAVCDENGRKYNNKNHFLAGRYAIKWKKSFVLNTGRHGVWNVLPKDHPEFKGKVFPLRNDSPNENYFSYEGLVLCVTRIETIESSRAQLRARNKEILTGNKQEVREGLEKVIKEAKPGSSSQIKAIG